MENVKSVSKISATEKAITALKEQTEKAITEFKDYEDLKITDNKSYNLVKKGRRNVISLRTSIEAKRKELKAPVLIESKIIDSTAKDLTAKISPIEKNLDMKVKEYESEKEKIKAEKLAIEEQRLADIEEQIKPIVSLLESGKAYNTPSNIIDSAIKSLRELNITEDIFQEKTEEVKDLQESGLNDLEKALEGRIEFEKQQEDLRLAQEAQARKEEDERVKQKAEQDRLDEEKRLFAEQQAQAAKEAEKKRRDEQARIDAENQKIAGAKAKVDAEKKAIEDAEKQRVADAKKKAQEELELALCKEAEERALIKRNACHDEAIAFNITVNNGQAMADEIKTARQEALKPDKEKLKNFLSFLGTIDMPNLRTDEGKNINQIIEARLRALIAEGYLEMEAMK